MRLWCEPGKASVGGSRVNIPSEFSHSGQKCLCLDPALRPHLSRPLDKGRTGHLTRRLPAAEADPEPADSCDCLVTSLPTAGQLVLP